MFKTLEARQDFKKLLEVVLVVVLMLYMASLIIGLPPNNDQNAETYTLFSIGKPAVYRVLVPVLARGLMLLNIPPDWSMAILLFASGVAAYFALYKLFELYKVQEYVIICYLMIYVLLWNYATPLDWTTVFLFSFGFYLMAVESDWYLPLFFVATFHRETVILLLIVYVLYHVSNGTINTHAVRKESAFQLALYIMSRLMLSSIFLDSHGTTYHFLIHDVMGTYLYSTVAWLWIVVLVFYLRHVKLRWRRIPLFVRCAFVLVPVQMILHILLGNPYEVRVLAESFPIAFLVMVVDNGT